MSAKASDAYLGAFSVIDLIECEKNEMNKYIRLNLTN